MIRQRLCPRFVALLLSALAANAGATFAISPATAQTVAGSSGVESIVLRAARLLDVRSGKYVSQVAILVEGERIKAVGSVEDVLKQAPSGVRVLDLGAAPLLPGLIDCH